MFIFGLFLAHRYRPAFCACSVVVCQSTLLLMLGAHTKNCTWRCVGPAHRVLLMSVGLLGGLTGEASQQLWVGVGLLMESIM